MRRSNSARHSNAWPASAKPNRAQDTPSRRHRELVRHPDSAIDSSGPFSGMSRRWSKRFSVAPDTPVQRRSTQASQEEEEEKGAQQSARSISPDEPPAQLRVPAYRFAMSPETPLNRDGDSTTDTATSWKQPPDRAPSSSKRPPRTFTWSTNKSGRKLSLNYNGQYYVGGSQANDPFTGSMAQTSFYSHEGPSRDWQTSGLEATGVTDTNPIHLARFGQEEPSGAARNSRVGRGEVNEPQLVHEKTSEMQSPRLHAEGGDAASTDEQLQPAMARKDPALYDHLQYRILQTAMDLWLLRCKIAESMEDWNAMENHGHEAHNLAEHLQWGPFVARCALLIGVARYKQGHWIGADESFDVAQRMGGYDEPQSEIEEWRRLVDEKLGQSLAASVDGMSAVLREERAPFITPLASVVEEKEDCPWPSTERDEPATADSPTSQYSTDQPELSAQGKGVTLLSDAPPQRHTPSAPLENSGVMGAIGASESASSRDIGPQTSTHTDGGSPADHILRLPSRPAQLAARLPAAIKISSDPKPASIGSPRLYDPSPGPLASPLLRTATPPLRIALQMARNTRSGLSEMELPSPLKQASRGLNDSADSANDQGGVPLDLGSLESVRLATETTELLPTIPSSSVSPFSIPHEQAMIAERPWATSKPPYRPVTQSKYFPNARSYVPQPESYQEPAVDRPPQAVSPDMARRWHQQKLKDARMESGITGVKNFALTGVHSARSTSNLASPRASVLHTPPPPPPSRPGWKPRQRPPGKPHSIYARRPSAQHVISERNANEGTRPRSVRPVSWGPTGSPYAVGQASNSGAGQKGTVSQSPRTLGRTITFADDLYGGKGAGKKEMDDVLEKNKSKNEDVEDSDTKSGFESERTRTELEDRREMNDDRSSDEGGGVSIEDGSRGHRNNT
ncbi:MAG: hypothetical protein LQ346_000926 [Caloplaca aetnensis]|nr:MAG: hypothetical protein LQ346_000926 [Caloplaca aetnensis]